ncbi:MAG: hypothetical protein O4753_08260 [Trichodesmium sp. St7_bin2_1]|nr:hypothetical protein [Trichodesmium sp. St7_bin2_1]
MKSLRKNLGSSQRSLRAKNFTPEYICWVLLGFASSTNLRKSYYIRIISNKKTFYSLLTSVGAKLCLVLPSP